MASFDLEEEEEEDPCWEWRGESEKESWWASSNDPGRPESSSMMAGVEEDRLKSLAVVSPAALVSSVAILGMAVTPFDALEKTFLEIRVSDVCFSSTIGSSIELRFSAEPTDLMVRREAVLEERDRWLESASI